METPDPISPKDLAAVVHHLPVLARPELVFGEWRTPPGQMPYVVYSPEALAFMEDVAKLMLVFDWIAWKEQAWIYIEDPQRLTQADLLTLRKLLTTHLCAERFNEGHLLQMYLDGHLTALLQRLADVSDQLLT
jgi:hypothetical protein